MQSHLSKTIPFVELMFIIIITLINATSLWILNFSHIQNKWIHKGYEYITQFSYVTNCVSNQEDWLAVYILWQITFCKSHKARCTFICVYLMHLLSNAAMEILVLLVMQLHARAFTVHQYKGVCLCVLMWFEGQPLLVCILQLNEPCPYVCVCTGGSLASVGDKWGLL